MFLRIRELELRKIHFALDFPPGRVNFLDDGIQQPSAIRLEGEAELVAGTLEIRVRGRTQGSVRVPCDLCLESAEFSVSGDFDLLYHPEGEAMPEEAALDPGTSEVSFYAGDGLDLRDLVREQVLLAIPMRRLCAPACKGICPECGQNRNEGDCGCSGKHMDTRWEALKNF